MKTKKTLLATALMACSPLASADLLLGVYAGAGIWNADFSGDLGVVSESISADGLGIDSDQANYYYVALEHFVPLIPNIRLAQTNVENEGDSTIDQAFRLETGGDVIPADTSVQSNIDLSHTDVTLYWEILDNYVSADIGLTARTFSGSAEVSYTVSGEGEAESQTITQDVGLSGTIPMGYIKLQLDLPFTNWYAGGHANYIGFDGDSFRDVDVRVGYLSDGLLLDFGFELGYRQMQLEVDSLDDLHADLSVDGPYASLQVHF